MKQITMLTPEFDIGDEAAFIQDGEQEVMRGTVKSITQTYGKHPKIFYKISHPKLGELVLPESSLLFAELSHIKPLFAIGMEVADKMEAQGFIVGINIEIDSEEYNITYLLNTGETISEYDIAEVVNASI